MFCPSLLAFDLMDLLFQTHFHVIGWEVGSKDSGGIGCFSWCTTFVKALNLNVKRYVRGGNLWYIPHGCGGGGWVEAVEAGGRGAPIGAPFRLGTLSQTDTSKRLHDGDCYGKGTTCKHPNRQSQKRIWGKSGWKQHKKGWEGVRKRNLGKPVWLCILVHRLRGWSGKCLEVPLPLL